jgi:hypothetical protein
MTETRPAEAGAPAKAAGNSQGVDMTRVGTARERRHRVGRYAWLTTSTARAQTRAPRALPGTARKGSASWTYSLTRYLTSRSCLGFVPRLLFWHVSHGVLRCISPASSPRLLCKQRPHPLGSHSQCQCQGGSSPGGRDAHIRRQRHGAASSFDRASKLRHALRVQLGRCCVLVREHRRLYRHDHLPRDGGAVRQGVHFD